jgi:hypothetical protein
MFYLFTLQFIFFCYNFWKCRGIIQKIGAYYFKALYTLGQKYKKNDLIFKIIPHDNLIIYIFCKVHMPTQLFFLKLVLAKHIFKYLLYMVGEGGKKGRNC